jgi:hypothetical protein
MTRFLEILFSFSRLVQDNQELKAGKWFFPENWLNMEFSATAVLFGAGFRQRGNKGLQRPPYSV